MTSRLAPTVTFATFLFSLLLPLLLSMPTFAAPPVTDEAGDGECAIGTLPEMAECTNTVLVKADQELNTIYLTIRTKLQSSNGENERQFIQAQKVWSAYRDGECDFQGSQMSGSAEAQRAAVSQCRLQETRERAKALKEISL